MQKEGQNNIYRILTGVVPKNVLSNKNRNKSWLYGYNDKYDFIVISRSGEIGDIISIQGLKIALPKTPKKCLQRHEKKERQYWEKLNYPNPYLKL